MAQMNQGFVDAWTLNHVATGYVAAKLGLSWSTYLALALGYEAFEHWMESPGGHPWFGTKRPESALNVTGDIVFGVLGYEVGKKT